MTDRELLELAAKAAGLTKYSEWAEQIKDHDSPHYMSWGLHKPGAGGQADSWNPLTDDGDALRLAVLLRLWVDVNEGRAVVIVGDSDGELIIEPFAVCAAHTATRRAIVRAASEIGKTK